jgi:imidazolonepropionase-like amidohydrolase
MTRTAPERFAVVAAEWFDGEHHHDEGPVTLTVEDGRIEAITPGDHGAALSQQGWAVQRGAFLMPGLVDAHVHLFLDGATTDLAQRAAHLKQGVPELTDAARRSARQALQCGVTLVRDAGDRHGINHRVRDEARQAASGMAAVRSGGLGVKRASRYGAFMARDVDDDASIRDSVRELARDNDEIKLILTGIIDFDAGAVTDEPQFDAAAASLVVATAHACGRKVFAHCSGDKGLAVAVAAGVDAIEHGFFMSRATLAQMRDRQMAWTPTFGPVHFQWAQPQALGWSPNTVGNLRRILDAHAEHLRLAHAMGVTLLLGTDAGSMGVVHGTAVFDEIDRFVEAGLPLTAVLAAATSAPRRHFGADPATLVAGASFDAVLLPASPFGDRAAPRRPQRVWRHGLAAPTLG